MQQNTSSMAAVLGISLLLLCNCGKSENSNSSDAELLKLVDFFPIEIGTRWAYKIDVGDIMPLEYRETVWSVGGGWRGYRERRQLQGADKRKKAYSLQFRIKGDVAPQERIRLDIPTGVKILRELIVEKDDLRIFGGAEQVFWEVLPGALAPVTELRIFDPSNGPAGVPVGPTGVPVNSTGYERKRMLFYFSDNSPLPTVVWEKPEREKLIKHGIETNVPGFEGTECLHFQKEMEAFKGGSDELPEGRSDELSKGWTEDMWFAKGRGLVRLIQRIDGKTAMAWNLDKFSSEPK